ncbi:MAG: DNA polymerase III subunit gamma/tau [Parasphingorhabdus sp.]|nr:DNA polymerase III subunit gamma/tau [Parasphingorhabdus sp.]
MSDSSDIFAASGVDLPATNAQPYRVLARKYRPSSFEELIGQDAMVQTLANAIRRGRIAHAFLLTGVRGVGKTSTARLIAKALNCVGLDGSGGPTINPCGQCEPCRAIASGSFIDVIEMDAASHTGVDDVREIIEAVRYATVSARYKIYIIDEVHMLSRNAFNALLKTLEEPPPHVKFLFATTEVHKLPITVLSRCQRFDLKRIPTQILSDHFAAIAQKEQVSAENAALDLIAIAAEGSVRDGLSILDQAIAHADLAGSGTITAAQVQKMLGLADRSAVRRLFAMLLEGDGPALVAAIDEQHNLGIEPLALLNGLLTLTHQVTLCKVGSKGEAIGNFGQSDDAAADIAGWAEQLSHPQIHRLWQLLLKGHEEVRGAATPREACDMALLRVQYAQELPDPATLARRLADTPVNHIAPPLTPAPERPAAQTAAVAVAEAAVQAPDIPSDFAAMVALVDSRDVVLGSVLRSDVRPIGYAPPELLFQPVRTVKTEVCGQIAALLEDATGMRWHIAEGEGDGEPTLDERAAQERASHRAAIMESPVVKAALEAFPDAVLLDEQDSEQRKAQA